MTANTSRLVRVTGDECVNAGRGHTQQGWYELASLFAHNQSVLDVGCGLGKGLESLRGVANSATGQDLDLRLSRDDIMVTPIESIPDKSYDFVTSVEVIEHVEDSEKFVWNLFRIARKQVFITTPNWTASRCQWPFHIKEYTPRELLNLVVPYGEVSLFKGNPSGDRSNRVRFVGMYHLLNDSMSWPPTEWFMKYLHKVLPRRCKIGSNIAVHVRLREGLHQSG